MTLTVFFLFLRAHLFNVLYILNLEKICGYFHTSQQFHDINNVVVVCVQIDAISLRFYLCNIAKIVELRAFN